MFISIDCMYRPARLQTNAPHHTTWTAEGREGGHVGSHTQVVSNKKTHTGDMTHGRQQTPFTATWQGPLPTSPSTRNASLTRIPRLVLPFSPPPTHTPPRARRPRSPARGQVTFPPTSPRRYPAKSLARRDRSSVTRRMQSLHVERKTETQWDVRRGGGGVEFA